METEVRPCPQAFSEEAAQLSVSGEHATNQDQALEFRLLADKGAEKSAGQETQGDCCSDEGQVHSAANEGALYGQPTRISVPAALDDGTPDRRPRYLASNRCLSTWPAGACHPDVGRRR